MKLLTGDVKPVQEDVEVPVFVVGHEGIETDGENGVELVRGDVKPAQEEVDASVEPAGGGEGMSKAVDRDVSSPLA